MHKYRAKVDSYGFRDQKWTKGDVIELSDEELKAFNADKEKHPLQHFEALDKDGAPVHKEKDASEKDEPEHKKGIFSKK